MSNYLYLQNCQPWHIPQNIVLTVNTVNDKMNPAFITFWNRRLEECSERFRLLQYLSVAYLLFSRSGERFSGQTSLLIILYGNIKDYKGLVLSLKKT